MLMLSDFIELALQGQTIEEIKAKAPWRFQAAATRKPVVVWNICQHCNMTCPHCYAAAISHPSPSDLSTVQAKAVIDDLYTYGVKVLIFSGGEPLLREDVLELIQYASSLGMHPYLSSNGSLIDQSMAKKLKDVGVLYVGISIDGLKDFNDHYRGLAGGFQKASQALSFCVQEGMKTGLRMTLTQNNADQLNDLIDWAEELGVQRFYVSHLHYSGRGKQIAGDDLSTQSTRSLLIKLFELAEQNIKEHKVLRLVTGSNDSDGVLLYSWIKERFGLDVASIIYELLLARGGNSAGEGIINIDHKGQVHPDQFWWKAKLGDLKKERIADVLENELVKKLRERTKYIQGRCGSCQYIEICRGSHRERAEAYFGDIWAEDPSCVMRDDEILS